MLHHSLAKSASVSGSAVARVISTDVSMCRLRVVSVWLSGTAGRWGARLVAGSSRHYVTGGAGLNDVVVVVAFQMIRTDGNSYLKSLFL